MIRRTRSQIVKVEFTELQLATLEDVLQAVIDGEMVELADEEPGYQTSVHNMLALTKTARQAAQRRHR